MSLENPKIFLCIVISLTICQYTRQYPQYAQFDATYYYDHPSNASVVTNIDESPARIAGGYYAKLGDFPYIAVVHQLKGNGLIGQCGGTVVSKRWVLTAGHCAVDYPRRFFVVFGITDKSGIQYDFLQGPGVSMITTQAFVHPHYSEGYNDIALLYMPHDIPFSGTIRPIKLAYSDDSFVNRDARVIGWGKDYMSSRGTKNLKYATLPVIGNNVCKQYWRITDKHVCTAAGLGRDACQGDSGGPLVVVQNGQDLQIGIVSYGTGYCPSNSPGVFTRVSSYANWIYQIMNIHYNY